MAIFHFPQYEQELFYLYWDRLHAYFAQCDSCGYLYGIWEILHVIDEGVNYEIHARFEYLDFYSRNVDGAWDFLNCWLRIPMNLRLVVLIRTTHPLASPIWPLLCVKLATVPIMTARLVHILFMMRLFLDSIV